MKYKKTFLKKSSCILLLLVATVCFSQHRQKITEIENIIDSAYEKASEANWTASATFSHKALKESQKNKYEKGESWSNFYLGQAFFELSEYKESLKSLKDAESLKYAQSDLFLLVEIYRVRSRVYASMSLFQESIREQNKGLKMIPEIKRSKEDQKYLTTLAYENLANTYKRAEKLDSAFYFMKKEEALLESMDESFVYPNLLTLYPQIGNYYSLESNYNEAEKYFTKTLKLSEKYNYPYRAYNYMKWGDMMMKKNKFEDAFHYYSLALESNKNTNREAELAEIYSKLSTVYRKLGDSIKADEFQLNYLKLENEIRNKQLNSSEFILHTIVSEESQRQQHFYKTKFFWILLVSSSLIVVLSVVILKIVKSKRKSDLKLENKNGIIDHLENKAYLDHLTLVDLARTGNKDFWPKFQNLYPSFKEELVKINPKITTSELSLAAYISLGFTTNEIADFTHRAFKTVETTRYNLRKKLQLDPQINLNQFLNNLI